MAELVNAFICERILSYATSYKAPPIAAGAAIKLSVVIDPVSGSDIKDWKDLGLGIAGVTVDSGLDIKAGSSDGAVIMPVVVIDGDSIGVVIKLGLTLGDIVVVTLGDIVVPTLGELATVVVTLEGIGVEVLVGHTLYVSVQVVPSVCPNKYD